MVTTHWTDGQIDTAIAYAGATQDDGGDYAPLPADLQQAIATTGTRWPAIAQAYLIEVGKRSGSTRTPTEYGRYIARFLDSFPDPTDARPPDVFAFVHGKGATGKTPSASTVRVRFAAISGFYEFARRMSFLTTNPATGVPRPRPDEPTPRGLSAEQIRQLLAVIPTDTKVGSRDRAIIITMVLTGLRRTEVFSLTIGDIRGNVGNRSTTYRVRAKGGYERHRDLPAPALEAMLDSLEHRGVRWEDLDADAPVFAVNQFTFYDNLRRYADKAGLTGVTPHVLRHSAAKLRRDTGASIEDVGALLGHRSLYTTARYLARLEGQRDEGWQGPADLLGL